MLDESDVAVWTGHAASHVSHAMREVCRAVCNCKWRRACFARCEADGGVMAVWTVVFDEVYSIYFNYTRTGRSHI